MQNSDYLDAIAALYQFRPIMTEHNRLIIGIDPDVDKSGVAIRKAGEPANSMRLENMTLDTVFEFLKEHREQIKEVRVSAGWLNKNGNAFLYYKDLKTGQWKQRQPPEIKSIAVKVGRNHAIGQQIVAYCQRHGINVSEHRPTMRSGSKLNKRQFERITGYAGRTNGDTRDAGMLVV